MDIHINAKDLQISYKTSSGAGGQHVNKIQSCVRIVHVPTGMYGMLLFYLKLCTSVKQYTVIYQTLLMKAIFSVALLVKAVSEHSVIEGVVAECQQERNAAQNKAIAMQQLRARCVLDALSAYCIDT